MTLQQELTFRQQQGNLPITIKEIQKQLKSLGYKLDRNLDCASLNRYVTGERKGNSYPAINAYVVEIDTGRSFANQYARRDENFKKLQQLRQELFAVTKGRIFEL